MWSDLLCDYQIFCKVSLKFVEEIWSYCIYIKLGIFWMFTILPMFFEHVQCSKTSWFIFKQKKLSFNHHIKEKLAKVMHGINVMRKLSNLLSRQSFVTIYKPFTRPHLDYRDNLWPMIEFAREMKACSIMLLIQKMVQSKEHFKQNHIKNLGWNPLSSDCECFVLYIKLNHLAYQSICLILFPKKTSLTMLIQPQSYLLQNWFFFFKKLFSFCNKWMEQAQFQNL